MSKKILVIGAGLAQVDAIKRARDLGYYVLASDGSSDAAGLKIAHEGRVIDVKDIENNLEWARRAKVHGVVSYASDVTLKTVSAIGEALGLPGLGRIPMEISLDKSRQRKRFKRARLSQPRFEVVDDLQGLYSACKKLNFPVVVKPVDNSGSRGVTIAHRQGELAAAFREAIENSKNEIVIVEEYIEGIELTVEGFSMHGNHHVLAISDKFKPDGSYRVATQLAYPAAISPTDEQNIISLLTSAFDVMEIDNSPTHSEIILGPEGPKIIEIGCRGGGFFVFTRVVEAASGYDVVGNWTKMCAGDPMERVEISKRGVVLRFYAAPPGRLIQIVGLEAAQKMTGVETELFIKKGEIVPKLRTDGSRTGWMIVRAKDREAAVARANLVSDIVKFETVPI